jgi:hypothetical protein
LVTVTPAPRLAPVISPVALALVDFSFIQARFALLILPPILLLYGEIFLFTSTFNIVLGHLFFWGNYKKFLKVSILFWEIYCFGKFIFLGKSKKFLKVSILFWEIYFFGEI